MDHICQHVTNQYKPYDWFQDREILAAHERLDCKVVETGKGKIAAPERFTICMGRLSSFFLEGEPCIYKISVLSEVSQ